MSRRLRFGVATALCVVAIGSHAQRASASTLLYGSYSFDPTTDLYTYNYALDNTEGSVGISEIVILGVRENSVDLYSSVPWPVLSTSPNGWNLSPSTGGVGTAIGSNYDWRGYLPVGSALFGFSFSVSYAPTTSPLNNYFLFGWNIDPTTGDAIDGGILEVGDIVAPDIPNTAPDTLPPPTTPLPATWVTMLTGLGTLGLFGWRRKRRAQAGA